MRASDDPSPAASAGRVRPAAVAGTFYPADRAALDAAIEDAMRQARSVSLPLPKALIAPHAGYVYSGPVAASAYALVAGRAGAIRRVVLLGPCHRVAVRGLALPDVDTFETPLGRVPLDAAAIASILPLRQVTRLYEAHAFEHSLEVQLPFLQRVLGAFSLVPLAVGHATAAEVAEVLETLWGGDETLIVVSSDLSHYLAYDEARAIDEATARAIVTLDTSLGHDQACGATPVAGLLVVARRKGLKPTLVDLRNSGDTAGDRRRVVGYGAFAFAPEGDGLDDFDASRGHELIRIARSSIHEALGGAPLAHAPHGWLAEHRASFVTLRRRESLRGCVGSLDARRPLKDDVASNAKAAAFRDPRFAPLCADELRETRVEVSLLSRPTPIAFADRDDLVARLLPGVDGLVIAYGDQRATFLPQVWSMVANAGEFVDELMAKARLPRALAVEHCTVERYRVRKWSEEDGA